MASRQRAEAEQVSMAERAWAASVRGGGGRACVVSEAWERGAAEYGEHARELMLLAGVVHPSNVEAWLSEVRTAARVAVRLAGAALAVRACGRVCAACRARAGVVKWPLACANCGEVRTDVRPYGGEAWCRACAEAGVRFAHVHVHDAEDAAGCEECAAGFAAVDAAWASGGGGHVAGAGGGQACEFVCAACARLRDEDEAWAEVARAVRAVDEWAVSTRGEGLRRVAAAVAAIGLLADGEVSR